MMPASMGFRGLATAPEAVGMPWLTVPTGTGVQSAGMVKPPRTMGSAPCRAIMVITSSPWQPRFTARKSVSSAV